MDHAASSAPPAAASTDGAPPDSRGPGETAAEASQGAPTKTQSRRRRRARAAARRGMGNTEAGRCVPAKMRFSQHAAKRTPEPRRLGPQRRASTPDKDGWQLVLRRAEGRSPPRRRPRRESPLRGIPPDFDGHCLNCLSSKHRIATCTGPRRCTRCRSPQHLAKDCKRPREHAAGRGRELDCRFVRQRHDSTETPQGSAADGETPPPLQPARCPSPRQLDNCDDPCAGFADGVPPGHLAFRPREAECHIQRDAAIDAVEAALQLALVAQPSGDPNHHNTSEVLMAVIAATEIDADDIRVKKYFPERFFILCDTTAIKDRVLAASPVPFGRSPLILLPWSRVAHANLSTLQYKLSIELEGVPPHVWREDTAAKLLAPYYWIQEVEAVSAVADDLGAFKLTAWSKDPSTLPKIIWLSMAEPPPGEAASEGVRFHGFRPFLTKKDMLRYKILVHLRCVRDFAPPPSDSDSSSNDPTDDRRTRTHHHSAKGSGVGFHPYPCRRGAPDGAAPTQHDGDGGGGRRHAHGKGPRARIPATQRVGPNGRARVLAQQRLNMGPCARVPATLRIGPNGLERVPVHQRLAMHKPACHHGQKKKGKHVWRPKQASRQDEPATNLVEAAPQCDTGPTSPLPDTYAATDHVNMDGVAVCPDQDKQGRHPEDHSEKEKIAPAVGKDGEAVIAPRDQLAAGARASSALAGLDMASTPRSAAPDPMRLAFAPCPVTEASHQDQRQTDVDDMVAPPSPTSAPSLQSVGGLSPQGHQGQEQDTKAHQAEGTHRPSSSTTPKQPGTSNAQGDLAQPDLVVPDGGKPRYTNAGSRSGHRRRKTPHRPSADSRYSREGSRNQWPHHYSRNHHRRRRRLQDAHRCAVAGLQRRPCLGSLQPRGGSTSC